MNVTSLYIKIRAFDTDEILIKHTFQGILINQEK